MTTPRRSSTPSSGLQADIALLPTLKNCLLNLPAPLVQLLLNSDSVVAQNVIVELTWRPPPPDPSAAAKQPKPPPPPPQRSVYLGWTGMPSQEAAVVEVDAASGG
ncbi:putative peroxisome biosynthesis protein (pas1 peroxin-1) protein [Teratosphaeria destructans]|uniref:Peroxisome biosynthesis protein (Pas1 peroxin-1) protein n=1 Tax=Teratosphaeria destructans TaxID=418781 RepID=A0A9W7SQE3_9PEZI|nr:putative peroxisome biosynthesis protein (pas1 peroxin-1) protein [Teratosphaeria destructans]